ncbi:hypothetical protein E4K10_21085 [Streptomyces sp. T1317-0309]|nr:hypothetical protein E4K10_21085 [Streptomyces sp. T1317-0309]
MPDPDAQCQERTPFDPGLLAATTDERMVRWWWGNRPSAPIVLATGGRAPCAVSLPRPRGLACPRRARPERHPPRPGRRGAAPLGRSWWRPTPWSSWASCSTHRTSSPDRCASTVRAAIWALPPPRPVTGRSAGSGRRCPAPPRPGSRTWRRSWTRCGSPHSYGCERARVVGVSGARRTGRP